MTTASIELSLLRAAFFSIMLATYCHAGLPAHAAPFTAASPDRPLSFPADHGEHRDFQTEWWYITGHLFREGATPFRDKSDYGFQLTFFRRALDDQSLSLANETSHLYLAHAALSDFAAQSFRFDSRLARGGLGLAGASSKLLLAWNHAWRAEMFGQQLMLSFDLQEKDLQTNDRQGETSAHSKTEIRLVSDTLPAPILHGQGGFSLKGECAACASHYYSFPRMRLSGHILGPKGRELVTGIAWMDHEFMSNALQPHQAGWDWFSMNRHDGTAYMLFVLRKKDGSLDFGSGTFIRNGLARALSLQDFSIQTLATWKSASGTSYPASWHVKIPGEGIDEVLTPRLADQELRFKNLPGSPENREGQELTYWEGAVANQDSTTIGYVELTGYAHDVGEIL